jgi:cysteine desulfurase/selenocysteine lyase
MNEQQVAISASEQLDIKKIRADFPMLQKVINGKQLIYLDSAATGQKPEVVMKRLYQYYTEEYAKPKEAHTLSQQTTQEIEDVRSKVASFIGAESGEEIIFSRGCTESINMVAGGFGRSLLKEGDEIVITQLEHHANIVPWLIACEQSGAKIKVVPIDEKGEVDIDAYRKMLSSKTKIVAFLHSSHVLGTLLPAKQLVELAHEKDIPVMVDGAQAAPHMPVNMIDLDCDFYTFSGHKMGSPSGVGILYGKKEWLNKLPPFEGGSDMAEKVTFENFKAAAVPHKFEAGTMPFAEIIAFGTLLDYLSELDMEHTAAYEQELLSYATEQLSQIEEVTIFGASIEKEPVLSFKMKNKDVKKLEKFLNDAYNITARAGVLSAQPLMKVLGVEGLLRLSFCYYNTKEEIDTCMGAIEEFIKK